MQLTVCCAENIEMTVSKKNLEHLLQPLGLSIEGNGFMRLENVDHKYISVKMFVSLNDLVYELFCKSQMIAMYRIEGLTRRYVKNPYFGCQSLEEALIRRDLMRDEA